MKCSFFSLSCIGLFVHSFISFHSFIQSVISFIRLYFATFNFGLDVKNSNPYSRQNCLSSGSYKRCCNNLFSFSFLSSDSSQLKQHFTDSSDFYTLLNSRLKCSETLSFTATRTYIAYVWHPLGLFLFPTCGYLSFNFIVLIQWRIQDPCPAPLLIFSNIANSCALPEFNIPNQAFKSAPAPFS